MAEVIVSGEDEQVITPVEQSAHEAAVAEGASAVQAQAAAVAAEEAKAAAEVALSAAQANIESGQAVEAAVEQANAAGASASVSAEMVHDALKAQTAAISALTEELRADRKNNSPVPGNSGRPKPDREPGGKPRWVKR